MSACFGRRWKMLNFIKQAGMGNDEEREEGRAYG